MRTLAIDASRIRSGGAIRHIIGLLSNSEYSNFDMIYVWAPSNILSQIPNDNIIKKTNFFINGHILLQVFWQACILPILLRFMDVSLLFALDSSTFTVFRPLVVLNQDILAYENFISRGSLFSKRSFRLFAIRIIQDFAFKRSDGIIFLTNYANSLITSKCKISCSLVNIPHGADDIFYSETWKHTNLVLNNTVPIRFVYLSNFDSYKHQKNVLLAASIVRKLGYNIHIDFIGGLGGEEWDSFNLLFNKLKVEEDYQWINIHGHIPHHRLPTVLSSYDIFIFASSCESFGISLLEGMCLGMPILCSNRSSLPETLNDGGIYFDPLDVNSISNSIIYGLSNWQSLCAAGQRANELSRKYTWSNTAKLTFEFLDQFKFTR